MDIRLLVGSNWRLFYADSNFAYLIADRISPYTRNQLAEWTSGVSELAKKLNSKFTYWNAMYSNFNIRNTGALLDSTKWKDYATNYAIWAIGSPTIEMFIASYNAKHTKQIQTIVANNATGYSLKFSTDSNYSNGGINNTSENLLEDSTIYCLSYVLASPIANDNDCQPFVGPERGGTIGVYHDTSGNTSPPIRPVACIPISALETRITIEK